MKEYSRLLSAAVVIGTLGVVENVIHYSVFALKLKAGSDYNSCIVGTADAMHQPVELLHLHAGIADYFHHGGQQDQNFILQPMKWMKSAVNL